MKQKMSRLSNDDTNVNTPTFWNDKYLSNNHRWDLGNITPLFINKEKKFKKKSYILVPGCGLGHDALYFAKKKHIVDAVDFSDFAIKFLQEMSNKNKININPIKSDFFSLNHTFYKKYDYIVEYTFFCAINPLKRLLYAEQCYKLLKDDGVFKGIFLPLRRESCNNPPYHVTVNDVENTFAKYFKIINIESDIKSAPQRLGNEIYIEMIKK